MEVVGALVTGDVEGSGPKEERYSSEPRGVGVEVTTRTQC